MRFLFFVGGWNFGGMETAYLSLMKGLKALGHQPVAIVCGWTNGIVPELLEQAGIPYHQVRLGRIYLRNPYWTWHTLWRMPAARWRLRRLAAELRPDWVIFAEFQMVLMAASLLPARRAIYLQSHPGRLMQHGWSARAIDRRLDRFVCVSDFIARRLPADRRKIAVVHNGVELHDAVPSAHTPVRIGIVGRIAEQKQHLVLLEACALLRRSSFELHILGAKSGTYVRDVEARIAALGLGDAVRWIGFVADRDALYGSLDIVAAPAVDEPFGLTVAEAGAYRLPVVVARSGAFPEIVEHGVTGLIFEPGNAEGCAQALQRLIDDAAMRRRLGNAGRARVAAGFTIEKMATCFLTALRPCEFPVDG
jgi:glycosyltransferase involved in cell wall biosynthesis